VRAYELHPDVTGAFGILDDRESEGIGCDVIAMPEAGDRLMRRLRPSVSSLLEELGRIEAESRGTVVVGRKDDHQIALIGNQLILAVPKELGQTFGEEILRPCPECTGRRLIHWGIIADRRETTACASVSDDARR
jgi:hypothetical protein